MENVSEFKGLNGNISAFKNEVEGFEKITFVGVPGVCTPFAELFSYAIRDKESHFISLTDINTSHKFEFKSFGMHLNEEVSDPHDSDAVVLLGGLSLPKANVNTDDINAFNIFVQEFSCFCKPEMNCTLKALSYYFF